MEGERADKVLSTCSTCNLQYATSSDWPGINNQQAFVFWFPWSNPSVVFPYLVCWVYRKVGKIADAASSARPN